MRLNLGYKINSAILLTFLVIVIIFTAIYVPFQNQRFEAIVKNVEGVLSVVIEQNREALANEIYQGLTDALELRLDRMLEITDFLLVCAYDRSGNLLASKGLYPPDKQELVEAETNSLSHGIEFRHEDWHGQYTIIFTREIKIIGERIGFIRVYTSMEGVKKELRISYMILSCMLASILITMLVLLNLFLSRTVIRPIGSLSYTMDRMQRGTIEQHHYSKSNDEIGDLSAAFNRMSRALATSYQELDTQKKQVQDSEEKYRLVVNNAREAIFVAQDGIVRFANQKFFEMSGYGEEEIRKIPFINFVAEEDRDLVQRNYTARMAGQAAPDNYIFRVRNKQGEKLWLDARIVLITWNGHPATLNFLRDITRQKKMEEQLQQAQKMEAVGTLAGGIAHDFNNLLQAIQGYTQLLLMDKNKSGSSHRELDEILEAARKGGELTRQLLTFSRRIESHMRPIDINSEINKVEQILSRTIPKMIEIQLNLAEDLYTVNADPGQIEQVLMNLAVNARDAMKEGGKIIIETENIFLDKEYCGTHLIEKPGEYILLSVSDTGHGINKDALEHIFEPFYTTKKVGEGTGLGLAMVYGIIMNHKGAINCYSIPGRGTTFKIYLPVIKSFKEDIAAAAEISAPPMTGTETILLVDDEEVLRDVGRQIFERFGYKVIMASDGEKALEIYRSNQTKIDLVILDLIMPGMGGSKCLEELLNINPEARIVIASGYFVNGNDDKILQSGAKGFIKKPYILENLLHEIRRVLEED